MASVATATAQQDAVATSSAGPLQRGRSESRTKGKGREREEDQAAPSMRLKSPPPTSRQDASLRTLSPGSSARGAAGSSGRRVRTVPPSAIYEPPTPPSPAYSPLPLPHAETLPNTASTSGQNNTRRKPPRQRLRYSSSSDTSADTDDEDESDDEPPWWTFTQRGMAKLRAKSLHRNGRDVEQGQLTEGESGNEKRTDLPPSKDKHRMSGVFLPSSRRGSKDKEALNSRPSSVKNLMRQSESPSNITPLSTPLHLGKLLQPAPSRFPNPTQQFFRRSPFHRDSIASNSASLDDSNPSVASPTPAPDPAPPPGPRPGGPAPMIRTKSAPTRPASAPTSPTVEAPSPGLTTLVDGLSSRLPSNEDPAPNLNSSVDTPPTRRVARRQMTSPNFPRFFRRNEGEDEPMEALTDTEVTQAARMTKKSRSAPVAIPGVNQSERSIGGIGGNGGESTPEGGAGASSTPNRPKGNRRRTSHMLRINLPPPISHHFANGWPHAGSWQDALYGYSDEYPLNAPKPRSRKSTKNDSDPVQPAGVPWAITEDDPVTPQRPEFTTTSPKVERTPTTGATEQTTKSGEGDGREANRKSRSRRQRKYRIRQAMVPPTPSGLGFTPRAREVEEGEYPWMQSDAQTQGGNGDGNAIGNGAGEKDQGFDWQTGAAQKELGLARPRQAHIEPERPSGGMTNLTRHDTNNTQTHTSATESVRAGRRKGWWHLGKSDGKGDKRAKRRKNVESDWRRRYRRMLFLDARVTIWIRLVNLAVVVVSLGLAITIRLELDELRLPGLIGSSTTLIMSYSCLTILHVLTAIYREYFGKPIGLWGLRSKMLWVCLDLLFVALWSSAMSLATNDLIATPLECTAANPWWKKGLASEYAELLADLSTASADGAGAGAGADTSAVLGGLAYISNSLTITLPQSVIDSPVAKEACRRQAGCIALSLLALLLYGGNMVLSLFRIFETVRRTANVSRAVTA